MELPLDPVQLTLLSDLRTSELAAGFRALVVADSEIAFAEAVSNNGNRFEIVYCGVTFVASIAEEPNNVSTLKSIFCNLDPTKIRSALIIGLGAHVAGGQRVPAVIQALLGIARKTGISLDVTAAIWQPAGIISGFDYFSQAVADYLGGGAFPVLSLINFHVDEGGAVTSQGLAVLAGNEIQAVLGDADRRKPMRDIMQTAHSMAAGLTCPIV